MANGPAHGLRRARVSLCLPLLLLTSSHHIYSRVATHALSSPSLSPRGSARTPVSKQRVAVFGCGGTLGACAFGFLQRAGSLYGTGLGPPVGVGATAFASTCLNKILSKQFVLAFASEAQVKLVNTLDAEYTAARLQTAADAVIVSTMYTLEQRPVTGNTYEKTPNDKTYEFYLDEPRAGVFGVGCSRDDAVHETILSNTIAACQQGGVKHVLVLETPDSPIRLQEACAKLLDDSNIPFTYIRIHGNLESVPDYTYIKGVQGDLGLKTFTLAGDYASAKGYENGDWIQDFNKDSSTDGSTSSHGGPVYREDVAALVVQSLQSLDWTTSRCMVVSSTSSSKVQQPKSDAPIRGRHDREWCVNSKVIAEKLASVQ